MSEPATQPGPCIVTENLSKTYRRVSDEKTMEDIGAVKELKMTVPRGSVYGFLGRNGAGKTTTIKMLLGMVHPTDGTAQVLGLDIVRNSLDILMRTAFVSESKALYDNFTATELMDFTAGFYSRWSNAAALQCAEALEIPLHQRFATLSKGNKAKVCLMLALGQNAELLVLDEPTAGLDPLMNDAFLRLLVEEHTGEGRTVFFSSHDLAEVEHVADWVGIIEGGSMMLEARLDDIRERYRLVIASGNGLPASKSAQIVAMKDAGNFRRYVVASDADGFATSLRRNGAVVTQVNSMSLREVFIELLRKEEPCISGNAGATLAAISSSS